MSNVQEQVVVEAVTQYGIRANGKNYGISPRLKEKGIEPSSFVKGGIYSVEVYTGPKGGKSINSFTVLPGLGEVSTVPSLPVTTLHETVAPGGIPPVTPARKQVKDTVTDRLVDQKTDWAAKDKSIETQAVLKSVLESPALAQMAVGKREEEVFQTGKRMFDFFLQVFKDAKIR